MDDQETHKMHKRCGIFFLKYVCIGLQMFGLRFDFQANLQIKALPLWDQSYLVMGLFMNLVRIKGKNQEKNYLNKEAQDDESIEQAKQQKKIEQNL